MTARYKDPGNAITIKAPSGGVFKDVPISIGGVFGIPNNDAPEGEPFDLWVAGEFYLDNPGGSMFQLGDVVYWDRGTERITNKQPGNLIVGVCSGEYIQPEADILTRLTGAAIEHPIGQGSMDLDNIRPGSDIGSVFQSIEGFTARPFTSANCTLDVVSGHISFQRIGIWRLDVMVNLTFTPDPTARLIYLRMFNDSTDTVKEAPIPLIVDPDAGVIAGSIFSAFQISEVEIDDIFVVQIGGGSDFSGVTWFDQTVLLTYLSTPM